ncbi:MAG: hypothetical protein QOF13_847 [Solirubrobacterales bacterium]|nr:hypothetical protein [Solirubrobacterales bacterium]
MSSASASPCPNEAVRNFQHSDGYLGECRAAELVNSSDKGNQNVLAQGTELGGSPLTSDGTAALWSVTGGAPGGASGFFSSFLAERTPAGWISRSIVPPAAEQVGSGNFKYRLETATPDLARFVFAAGGGSTEPNGEFTALRIDRAQHQDPLQTYPVYPTFLNRFDVTDDGAHVLAINPGTGQLEDIGAGVGAAETLSVMPDGSTSECGLELEGQSFVGFTSTRGAGISWRPGYHRMSATDASRVYFETSPDEECFLPYGLYVRNREANGGGGATTLIDPGSFAHEVNLVRATPDGRSVYFVTFTNHASYGELPAAEKEISFDPVEKDLNEHADVYRWDEETDVATCLTCVLPDANLREIGEHAAAVAVSDDFSHVYFESASQLVAGEGEEGRFNIYSLSGGTLRFVATPGAEGEGCECAIGYDGGGRSALSSDGGILLFTAPSDPLLTAQAGLPPEALPEKCTNSVGNLRPCNQLYRYDEGAESLECVSCLAGGTTTFRIGGQATPVPNGLFGVSADGSTVAFVTPQPLLPIDINGTADIYEWRNEALHLITDGVTKAPVGVSAPAVNAIDADGSSILFTADEPGLTGFETDGLANLYDARIGGGFIPSSSPPHCTEESCQGPVQGAPGFERAGSLDFRGAGNVAGPRRQRCAKGKVRRHGRCTKRHPKRHHAKRRQVRQSGTGVAR